jgi:6-phosphofructokinase 1
MAGKTGIAVGRSLHAFTHIPLRCLTQGHKHIDPEGQLWLSVLESTGQPFYLTSRPAKRLARVSYVPQH